MFEAIFSFMWKFILLNWILGILHKIICSVCPEWEAWADKIGKRQYLWWCKQFNQEPNPNYPKR